MPSVALIYPQIPPNTGNIARTCAATKTTLHLVEPLGFDISDRALKRAGLDYWPYVDLRVHPHLDALAAVTQRWVCFCPRGTHHFRDFAYHPDDCLLFGSETEGLPPSLLERHPTVFIPIAEARVRSFNLSVSVAIGLFEAIRQLES